MLELNFGIAWALIKAKKDERIEGVVRGFDPNMQKMHKIFCRQDFLQEAVKGGQWKPTAM